MARTHKHKGVKCFLNSAFAPLKKNLAVGGGRFVGGGGGGWEKSSYGRVDENKSKKGRPKSWKATAWEGVGKAKCDLRWLGLIGSITLLTTSRRIMMGFQNEPGHGHQFAGTAEGCEVHILIHINRQVILKEQLLKESEKNK